MVRPWNWPKNGMPELLDPFTWIQKGKLAISWWPDPYVVEIYYNEGIKVIINCSELDNREDIPQDFKYYHIKIPAEGIPIEDQLNRFFEIINESESNNQPMVVHCVAGCGRSGIVVVAWAVYKDIIPKGIDPVEWIRDLRPCCLKSEEQIEFARKIAGRYQNLHS
jgi:protein-tyrosine phosphatase